METAKIKSIMACLQFPAFQIDVKWLFQIVYIDRCRNCNLKLCPWKAGSNKIYTENECTLKYPTIKLKKGKVKLERTWN